jgi:hypothetical protein
MADIDARFDNGDLDSGSLRRRTNGYINVIEE